MGERQKTQRLEAAAAPEAKAAARNGIHKVVWWIMGIISASVVAGFSGWISSVYARVTENNDRTIRLEERMKGTDERLQERVKSIDDRLQRIELKIDAMRGPK